MAFETNVFVNCPFDDDFKKVLRPLLFTIICHGLKPRIATERIDSGEPRISKIIELIKESKYSIHDLSRVKASAVGEIFRLNMPYELGIDVGCREFGSKKLRSKRYLVTAAEHYEYQKALSDIAGSDIGVHNNDAQQTVRIVRQWLDNVIGGGENGSQAIWSAFEDFNAVMYDDMVERGFDVQEIENIQTAELIRRMEEWVIQHKLEKSIDASLSSSKGSYRSDGISVEGVSLKAREIAVKTAQSMKDSKDAAEALRNARRRAAGSFGR